ncbi:ABC transporter ATP-binding protein/permease [Oceanimonas sp. NS1]|nr:ABC transporter ATP-binding protein/permease [Oceanimonas sp. NS1]
MFKLFESLTQPFPDEAPTRPPKGLYAFCRHYTRGFEWPLVVMALLSATVAVIEVALLGFMGQLVDLLASHSPESFWAEERGTLILGCVGTGDHSAAGLWPLDADAPVAAGNYPMSIRWQAHRYLLNQSMSFYQDEFAGRIATKVMQTALAVRETVMKLLDVLVYVSVYFIAMLVMMGQSDLILMLPILLWLLTYIGIQCYFVPRMKRVATAQADARSMMTGRIVDSYANITTVKLFAHADAETRYARRGMRAFLDTVYGQMRLATGFVLSVDAINYLLLFTITALSIGLWMNASVTVGVIAVAISIALRLQGMSKWIMWEIGALFENIGTVIDGMNTLSKSVAIEDKAGAEELTVNRGAIRFEDITFQYGRDEPVIEHFNLNIRPGERWAWWVAPGRASPPW